VLSSSKQSLAIFQQYMIINKYDWYYFGEGVLPVYFIELLHKVALLHVVITAPLAMTIHA